MTAAMARMNMPAPTWSILRRPVARLRAEAQNPAAASTPTGRFIQKIQAQETCAMMRPPASGPSTAESAQTLAS